MATWKPLPRNYNYERSKLTKSLIKADSHPLKDGFSIGPSKPAVQSAPKVTKSSVKDPLMMMLDGGDPLSPITSSNDPLSVLAIAASEESSSTKKAIPESQKAVKSLKDDPTSAATDWEFQRSEILSKYTTSEKLSITTSFLSSQSGESVRVVQQTSVSDKVKHRLEQLDDFEDGSVKEMLNLSQQDYIKRIDELSSALKSAWEQDQRVKTLKIAIQCAKLLSDVSVMQFYPSKFVLITDILDTFGQLVYQRIWEKSTYTPSGSSKPIQLPESFTPDQVPESAKETCRNWFFKISSIREILPRFYMEVSVLKCYKFFKPNEMVEALMRLATMCRGISNPLVAAHARCYLCRVGKKINAGKALHVKKCFDDILLTYSQVQSDTYMAVVSDQNISLSVYLSLYSPAINWVLQCLSTSCTEQMFLQVLNECQQHANSGLLLNGILRAFNPEYISKRAILFLEAIKGCDDTGFPKNTLYNSLGSRLSLADPPEEDKLKILNEVWKFITKLKDTADYIHCVECWMDYVMKHFGKKEMNTVLADIVKHMTPDRAFEDHYPSLLSLLKKILEHVHNFSLLFSTEKFLSFVDMFQKDSVKVSASKIIVEAFVRYQMEAVSDPVIIGSIMFMCKTLHDSVNALSLDDERRSVSQLVCSFIHKVDYGKNFEQQLDFYVESRANFTNLDIVIADLVQSVNNLAVSTRRIMRGNHTTKTSAFVRACSAYCFITIPSLESVFMQLNLYLLSAQVALHNLCLSQAEALFKAGIAAILDMPKTMIVEGKPRSSEPFLIQYVSHLLSALVIVPDNPDQGVLVIIKGLINVIKGYSFEANSTGQHRLFLSVLGYLATVSQEKYLYHVDKVESNDTLYGHDPKFQAEINEVFSMVINEILEQLKKYSEGYENLKVQSSLALTTLEYLISFGDMADEPMVLLGKNLWMLSQKYGYADSKTSTRVLSVLRRKAQISENYSRLLTRISSN